MIRRASSIIADLNDCPADYGDRHSEIRSSTLLSRAEVRTKLVASQVHDREPSGKPERIQSGGRS